MATQTTTQRTRIEGTPAPLGAYPKPYQQKKYPWTTQASSSFIPTSPNYPQGQQPNTPTTPRRSTSAPPRQTSSPTTTNPRGSAPPNGDDPGDSGPDDVNDEGNDDDSPWEEQDNERHLWEGTPFPEERKTLNTREDFSGDVPPPEKNSGEGKFKEPAVFDDWALKITDLLELREISLMDPKAIF